MSVADAWVHQEMLTKRPQGVTDVLVARLQCNKCFGSGSSDPSIIIGSEKYHDNLALTSAWFEYGFIHGFATILNHDAHTSVMPYTKGTTIVRLVNCHHPNETITEILGYGSSTTHLVSVVYNKSHFVVLYYDLGAKTVVVFDGLRFSIESWIKHIVFTVKRYGLVPLAANYAAVPSQDCFDVVLDTSTRSSQKRTAVSKQTVITFEGQRNPWIVGHDTSYQQSDGHNCGPIACIKLMEIFGAREPGTIHEVGTDPKHPDETYRSLVMNYYESRLKLYDSILKVQFRPLKKNEGAVKVDECATTTTTGIEIDSSPDITKANVVRNSAMTKKNAKQKASAEKEILRLGTVAVDSGAAKGAVVSLHVDYRTNAHAQALVAIIYDVKKTGGVLVCSEHGIITHDGSANDYWVPADKYRVVAKYDEKIPLPDELIQVRDLVLTDTFDPTGPPRISYNKLHEVMIGATSPLKRKKGCGCKGGRCGNNCGCKRHGVRCHSGCKCNGNCSEK